MRVLSYCVASPYWLAQAPLQLGQIPTMARPLRSVGVQAATLSLLIRLKALILLRRSRR